MVTIAVVVAVLAAGAIGVAAVASRRPDSFRIERSALIDAPAERIFPLIVDLETMNSWNPFNRREAGSSAEYIGPKSGVGAKFAFNGPKSGTGTIEITDARVPSLVAMRLLMSKPMAADNHIEFRLVPDGKGTRVAWSMDGACTRLLPKLVGLVMNMDSMVGREFDTGLARLKSIAEAR